MIDLQIQAQLLLYGTIRAVGGNGSGGCNNWVQGGGAGGSILINASAISGTGSVISNGGNGGRSDQGGGGGGRIAIYTCDQQLPLSNFRVNGGSGFQAGQPGTIYFGSGTITITQQPQNASGNPGDNLVIQAAAMTSQPDGQLEYQWRKRDGNGAYLPLTEGQSNGRYTGVNTPTLSITNATCGDSGEYDCLVTDSCGAFPTQPARVIVDNPADFNADGLVNFFDVSAFLSAFNAQDPAADIAPPFGVWNFFDISIYLTRYNTPCP
jgi:hypothetical protein